MRYYCLNPDHTVYPCDALEMAKSKRSTGYKVAYTEFTDWKAAVSTVFLGLDHNWEPDGPPLIFETMVFASDYPEIDQDCERYSTWDDALKGHNNMVDIVEGWLTGRCLAEGGVHEDETASLVDGGDGREADAV